VEAASARVARLAVRSPLELAERHCDKFRKMQCKNFMKRSNSTDMRRGTLVRTKVCVGTQVACPRRSCFGWKPPRILEISEWNSFPRRAVQKDDWHDNFPSFSSPAWSEFEGSQCETNSRLLEQCTSAWYLWKVPEIGGGKMEGFSDVKSWNKAKLASADESAAPIHPICFLHFSPLFYPVSSFDEQVVAYRWHTAAAQSPYTSEEGSWVEGRINKASWSSSHLVNYSHVNSSFLLSREFYTWVWIVSRSYKCW
jgi:hypothetical protein